MWLALVALVLATAAGPAPVLVPTGITAVLVVVYVAVYGPWRWKQSRSWLRATSPATRAIAWYGYGHTRAELVLRPRLVWRLVLWPLLPWTMYCRVELREGKLVSFGHPRQQSPVVIDAATAVVLDRPLDFTVAMFRFMTITHPSGGRIRLSVTVWSRWRQLARVLDPYNRLGLDFVDWRAEQFDDDGFDQNDIDA
jgi:hypothetical protein